MFLYFYMYLKTDFNHVYIFIKPLCFLAVFFMVQLVDYRLFCAKVNVAQQWECYSLTDQEIVVKTQTPNQDVPIWDGILGFTTHNVWMLKLKSQFCVMCNSRYGRNWMKKSLKNLNKVMCYSHISVFKEDDDCEFHAIIFKSCQDPVWSTVFVVF